MPTDQKKAREKPIPGWDVQPSWIFLIAEEIGNPNSYRAVGLANNKNPLSVIVPCHRVIGANGDMIGYGGGLNKKRRMLELEKNHKE